MFGLSEAMLGFIRRQIGLRTDAASATGSVHAKLGDLRSYLYNAIDSFVSTRQKPRGVVAGSKGLFGGGSGSTWVTALNVTGKGKLLGLGFQGQYSSGYDVRITVDGYVVFSGGVKGNTHSFPTKYFYVNPYNGEQTDVSGSPQYAEIEFKSSLKIEMKGTSDFGTYWLYVLE
jgi:hypothetical protein